VNKSELIEVLTDKLGDRKTATAAVEGVVDAITRAVAKGEKVGISGFGVFEKVDRAARTARNPATGAAVKLKKTSIPKFRPGQGFKDIVSGAKKVPPPAKDSVRAVTARGGSAGGRAAAAPAKAARPAAKAAKAPTRPAAAKAASASPAKASKAPAKASKAPAKAAKAPARSAGTARSAAATAGSSRTPAKKVAAKAPATSAAKAKAPAKGAAKATKATKATKAPAKKTARR
jgi:DNA-binding protein HU-beta